jgi:hypothetical protein
MMQFLAAERSRTSVTDQSEDMGSLAAELGQAHLGMGMDDG